jgi:putative nucleotidyltransferase with HDIG domain
MSKERFNRNSRIYQGTVSAAGICIWLAAAAAVATGYGWRDLLTFAGLVPVIIVIGLFVQHFRLPLGSRFSQERITFTLTDAFVLLVACWFGTVPAVFLAGIEGFTSSRRTVRRLSSNLFSSSMMSIGAAVASLALALVMQFGFGEQTGVGADHSLSAVAVGMLAAGIAQIATNIGLFSTLFVLRQDNNAADVVKGFLWAVPMFLPNSAAATLMFYALQHDITVTLVVAGPVVIAIYLGQRQYREGVQKRIAVMEKAHRETIEALAVAINAKDEVTHEHVLRVQIYAAGVARKLGCSNPEIEALKAGALLHDIGKIAVPDYILQKPGKLTAAEFEKMKIHTIAGAQILGRVEFPYPIVPVVRHHHERWDGKGYPDGLAGDDIPLTARILTVVDCFDAVREDRQYRKAMSREEAIDLIVRGSGTQYDPRVVGTFVAHLHEFEEEIRAHAGSPAPTFGIEPSEQLSESARRVAPAAGFAEEEETSWSEKTLPDTVAALSDLAKSVISARGQDELLAAFAEKLKTVVPHDMCAVTLVDPESGQSVVAHATGQYWMLLKGRTVTSSAGVTGWVLANRKPFSNTDPRLDLPASLAELSPDYRTLAVFPIISDTRLFGAVSIYSGLLSEYSANHQRLMRESVSLLASALSVVSAGVDMNATALAFDEEPSQMKLSDSALDSELMH